MSQAAPCSNGPRAAPVHTIRARPYITASSVPHAGWQPLQHRLQVHHCTGAACAMLGAAVPSRPTDKGPQPPTPHVRCRHMDPSCTSSTRLRATIAVLRSHDDDDGLVIVPSQPAAVRAVHHPTQPQPLASLVQSVLVDVPPGEPGTHSWRDHDYIQRVGGIHCISHLLDGQMVHAIL